MSDLTATNCGCGCENGNGMSSCLWIILLLCCCGGCGNGFSGNGFEMTAACGSSFFSAAAAGSETTAADADPSGILLQTNKGVRGRIPHASFFAIVTNQSPGSGLT